METLSDLTQLSEFEGTRVPGESILLQLYEKSEREARAWDQSAGSTAFERVAQ